jgi:predicted O-methyltransferase YrrM
MTIKLPLEQAHSLLAQAVRPGDSVIDATAGYGQDTVFLADQVKEFGHVYGFDIQADALKVCENQLIKYQLQNQVTLFNQGHEKIITLLPPELKIQAAIFSLGGLTPEDGHLTLPNTTISAYHQVLSRLHRGGIIVFLMAQFHEGSAVERDFLISDLTRLDPAYYRVNNYQPLNQGENAGQVIAIERL